MTWVTRARVIPSRRSYLGLVGGLAGLQESLPLDSLAQEFDDPGVLGSLGRFGLPRHGGTALTTRSAGTRRVRVPMLAFSKAPLGPRAISTVCSGRRPWGRRPGCPG